MVRRKPAKGKAFACGNAPLALTRRCRILGGPATIPATAMGFPMRMRLPLILAAGLMAAPLAVPLPVPAQAARTEAVTQGLRLVMVDLKGCGFCAAFKREVLPGYATRAEGRAAPLSVIEIDGPWPDGIVLDGRPRVTPTFILLRGGIEQSRIEGYAGPDSFWPGLRDMLANVEARP